MITVSTTCEDEARDVAGVFAGILPGGLPPDRDWQIILNGREYAVPGKTPRQERRDRMRELIRAAGPGGIMIRDMSLRLYREDRRIPRATLYRWMRADQAAGLVCRVGGGAVAWCGSSPEVTP